MKQKFSIDRYPKSTALLLGCAFGLSACFNTPWVFGLWLFLPIVWLAFPSRWYAALFITLFYLSVAWEIVPDILNYRGWGWESAFLGVGIWCAAGLISTIPWLICFPVIHHKAFAKPLKQRLFSLLFSLSSLLFLLTVPPFGAIIWGDPLTSAGLMYPGLKLWGLGLCALFIMSLSVAIYLPRYRCTSLIATGFLLLISAYAQFTFPSLPKSPSNWVALDTSSRFVGFQSYVTETIRESLALFRNSTPVEKKKKVIVLPENVVNLYDVQHHPLWKKLIAELTQADATLIIGAYGASSPALMSSADIFQQKHNEGILIMDQNHGRFYPTRQPVPFLSWHPMSDSRVGAHWWQRGVYPVQNYRVGIFVCFEDFLPWIMIMTALDHPDILISIANHWWDMPTAIHKQLWIFQLWARLLNTPVLIAENLQ